MQNSNMRLRGIVRHQRRPKQTVDPRQMKNQLVVDAMALIEPEPEPEPEDQSVLLALEGFREPAPQLQFPLTREGFPDDSGTPQT